MRRPDRRRCRPVRLRRRYRFRKRGYLLPAVMLVAGVCIGAALDRFPSPENARGSLDFIGERAMDWSFSVAGHVREFVTAAHAETGPGISGPARVIDGDTLDIRGTRIRLHGIDAPESAQQCRAGGRSWACGRQASGALARAIDGRPVACRQRDRDRYGRIVAVCRVGGTDLNRWMVSNGWAWAYRKYDRRYIPDEKSARSAGRGVWQGEAVPPWEWRRGRRLAGEFADTRPAAGEAPGKCVIKGNLSSSGRIYHVPGGRHYDRTRIDTARGERWFCSEREARAAGWRRSRQ